MTKEEAMKLQPFDVVVARVPARCGGMTNRDLLVKRVTENGVFCLERIQSTAVLYKFEDIEYQ